MITVWRMQNAAGRGPYRGSWDWQTRDHLTMTHPGPEQDFPKHEWLPILRAYDNADEGPNGTFRFGFATKEQAEAWFDPTEMSNLHHTGFELVELEAAEILAQSDKQLVFLPAVVAA